MDLLAVSLRVFGRFLDPFRFHSLFLVEEVHANVEAPGKHGEKPIHRATIYSLDALKYLVEEVGVDIDAVEEDEPYQTSLHIAVACNSIPVVKYLLSQGADKLLENNYAQTPIMLAETKEMDILLGGDGLYDIYKGW